MIEDAEHLLTSAESEALDFKQESYKLGNDEKKNEVLKDISAFANHPSDEDKYIIIGVKEKNGFAVGFQDIDSRLTETNYQQFIDQSIEPRINFSYGLFEHLGCKLAFIKIFNNYDRPYLFKKDMDSMRSDLAFRKGSGFIRDKTLIRRLERQDFDKIYIERFKKRDRKNDLIIEKVVDLLPGNYSNAEIYFLDLNFENRSNQSLSFNLELSILNGECITLNEIEASERVSAAIVLPSFEICSRECGDKILFSTCIKQSGSYDIHLDQASKQSNVFSNQILFLNETIKATLTLRSDEFDGPMIEELTFQRPS